MRSNNSVKRQLNIETNISNLENRLIISNASDISRMIIRFADNTVD